MHGTAYHPAPGEIELASMPVSSQVVTSDWQAALPVLGGNRVTLRDLQLSDAPSLLAMLTTEEVARFISPPPTTGGGVRAIHPMGAP